MDPTKPALLAYLLTQRRTRAVRYAVEIDWTIRGTVRYVETDQTAGTSEEAWLVSATGAAESLQISNDGSYSQSIGSREIRLSEGFGAHLSTDEPVGRACRLYLYPEGGIDRRVLVAKGLLDESSEPYDPTTRTYGLTLLSPLYILQNKLIPQYVISTDDLPTAPDDAVGKPLPIVFGTVANHPLMLIQDWPDSDTSAAMGPTDATMSVDDASDWPGDSQFVGVIGADLPVSEWGAVVLTGLTAGMPSQGIIQVGSELIGYATITYSHPDEATISPLFRGWGGTTVAAYGIGLGVQLVWAAAIEYGTPNQEIVTFTGRASNDLSGLTRGLFAGLTGIAHDEGSPVVCLTGIPIIHAAAGHECYSFTNSDVRERQSGSDRPQRVYYPMTADPDDAATISGQTIASLSVEFPHLLQQTVYFETPEQQTFDYGAGADLPFKNYALCAFDYSNLGGTWYNDHFAHDEDFADPAITLEQSDSINSEFIFDNPSDMGFSNLIAFIHVAGPETGETIVAKWDAIVDGVNVQSENFGVSGPNSRTATTATSTGVWELVDGATTITGMRVTLTVPGNSVPSYWLIYEVGIVALYDDAWGWANPVQAANNDLADYAEWASPDPTQIDILSLPFGTGSSPQSIVGVQLSIRHYEPGSVEGDWTLRRARVRFGETPGLVGEWTSIPLRGAEYADTVSLPLPSDDITEDMADGWIEVETQATMGVTMRIVECSAVLWTDTITDTSTVTTARDMLARSLSGAVDSGGSIITRPSDAVQWYLEEQAGLTSSWIDSDSFDDAADYEDSVSWQVNGVLSQREPVSAGLQRLSIAAGGLPLFTGASFEFWRWPLTSTVCQWQFVHNPLGSANVVNGSVSYRRFGLFDLASGLTVNYRPRGFSTERAMVRSTSGRRPPSGGGDRLFAKQAHRLDLPFTLSYSTDPTLDGWSYGRYGDVPDRIIDAELCGDATSAALVAEAARNIFSRKRWIVTLTVGPWGELVNLGSLAEFCDIDLPATVIQGFRRNGWWDGVLWGDEWPDSLRGFYMVIVERRQNDDGTWTLTGWEWCEAVYPPRG